MAFLLDTNACIDYFTARYPKVVARIQASSPEDLFLSAVVEEIEPLDFDLRAAAIYGRVRARLEAGGTPIGPCSATRRISRTGGGTASRPRS